MKAYFNPLHDLGYIKETLRLFQISCPVLLIVAKQSPPILTDMQAVLSEIKTWKNVNVIFLDVGHDIHITHPEIVAPYISDFLLKLEAKL